VSSVALVLGGLVALLVGAEVLVRSGSGLAARLGVGPMVIGLTVVSIGTSLPELAIGIDAARTGSPGLAVGNIVGTNLVNLLFILGLSAVIAPIAFARRTLRFDVPCTALAAAVLYLLARDGTLSALDGVVLVAGGAAYTWGVLRSSRGEAPDVETDYEEAVAASRRQGPLVLVAGLVVSIAVIILGAELLVEGSVRGARTLGVSEAVIGLTVVAVGTSAPELVTTLVSTVRKQRDLAIGNLLGSSIYNIAVVLGITVLVAPGGLAVPDEVLAADLVLMVVVAIASVPVLVSGARITRLEGAAFVATYVGYVVWLLVTRTG
jgi:cation:H+ antiporter